MNKIYQLLNENKGNGLLKVENLNSSEATIYLHGMITDGDIQGGVNALDFIRELNNIKTPIVNLRINSAGGDVFGARAMVAGHAGAQV